jgi:hypothetical protein
MLLWMMTGVCFVGGSALVVVLLVVFVVVVVLVSVGGVSPPPHPANIIATSIIITNFIMQFQSPCYLVAYAMFLL